MGKQGGYLCVLSRCYPDEGWFDLLEESFLTLEA
jgi:hypothetical protein